MFKIISILCVILILSDHASSSVCPKIKFSDGKMISTDDVSGCIFTMGDTGGREFKGTEIVAYSVYGIVHFNCGVCESVEVSLYNECKDCSFCLHNEHIKGCRAVVVPILIAVGITLIMIVILMLLAWCTNIPDQMAKRVATFSIYRAERRMERRKRSAKKLIETGLLQSTVTNQQTPEIPPRPTTAGERENQVHHDKPGFYPNLYMELKDVQASWPRGSAVREEIPSAPSPSIGDSHNVSRRPTVSSFSKTAIVAGLLPTLMLGRVDCCDTTAYVSSSNLIYRDSGLTEQYSGLFLVSSGQSVCLKYTDDSIDRITIVNTWLEDIYSPMYRTSNYELTTETKWNCMGAGLCWSGYCQKDSMHPDWASSAVTGTLNTFGCFQSAAYCSHCTYNKQCVYYKATIKPKGSKYIVMRLLETNWKARVQITHHDGSIEFQTISNQIITGGEIVKVGLTAPSYSQFHYQKYLITNTEDVSWNVHASELGDLSQAMIGDLQIGLYDDKQIAYMTTGLDCQPNSCSTQCSLPESGLMRGLKQYRNYTVDTISFGSDKIVKRSTRMSFSMFVTTTKEFGLNVIEAECQFTLLATYGCTACSKASVAYIQAKELKSNGLVKFTSNCTLDTDTLSCQEAVQQIKISGHQEKCDFEVNCLCSETYKYTNVTFSY